MKRYTASQLRAHLSEALDEAERSGKVAVERGTQTFHIVSDRTPRNVKAKRKKLVFDLHDDQLVHGWTWEWQGPGRPMKLRVRPNPKRRRK
jgi:hypothetical protein